ncbi:nucleotide sugar dehydrogenase, partial [Pseudomonas sp.]|uniref:nucleotide sugar dehydrogenase n=1 Tax=Pseudomonas sp. TaxID=306 RepID=UPI003266E304
IADYDLPPMTVIGEFDKASGDVLQSLYEELDAPIIRKDIAVAEMIKYTCNVWHATKVTFANEIGNIAKAVGVDGREVMEVVCQDKTLNLSQYYMRPGFAFGGSCLPKDVRALTYRAGSLDVEAPLLNSLMRSNESQVQNAFDIVTSHGKRKVALLGLSFKAGTDDLRESPLVDLAEMLIGKGYDLSIYDTNVEYARVHGANKEYIESKIPHVSSLLNADFDDVINNSDVIILGNRDEKFRALAQNAPHGKQVIDLVGFMSQATSVSGRTEGICW